MRFQFIFGFILLILFFVGIFVGLPYLLQALKSNQLFSFSKFFSSSTSTPGFFYSWTNNWTNNPTSRSVINTGESLYKGKVSIGGISGGKQINLSASYLGSAINITGWRIKSAQRGETLIGKGINLLQFDTANSDIWLLGGESAEIIAGASPVVSNYRVNICFGGLSDLYNLGSGFSCPTIEPGDLTGLDSACQDLILRNSSCRAPSDNILNKQSSKCRIWFEKNVNYSACVVKHMNDKNFYKGWKIYTGNTNQIFDPLHDKIELRDQAGLLIDRREY